MKSIIKLFLIACLAFTNTIAQTDFWQPTNGPFGCSVNDLTVDHEGRIYAATDGSGIYRSDDEGESWIYINEGLPGKVILAVAVNDSGHVFISVDHDIPEGDMIFRSKDYGVTWTYLYHYGGDLSDIALDSSNYIYVSDRYTSIIKSIDNGESWIDLGFENPDTPSYVYQMASNDSGIYAASNTVTFGKKSAYMETDGLFFSNDGGDTWNNLIDGPFQSVSCTNNGFIIVGKILSDYIYVSEDFGSNWDYISDLYDVRSFLIFNDTTIYAACANGLFKSVDKGKNWYRIEGVPNIRVNTLAKYDENNIYTGTTSNIIKSEDSGVNWEIKNEGIYNPAIYTIIADQNGNVMAGGYKGGLYTTSNKGIQWNTSYHQIINQYDIYSLALNSQNRLFIGTSQPAPTAYLYFTDNLGLSFNRTPIYELQLLHEQIWSITVANDDILFLGTNGDGVIYSDDNGDSLKFTNLSGGYIRALASNSSGNIIAGILGNGIYISPDKGNSWLQKNDGLTSLNVYSIAPSGDSTIYTGTATGLFKSDNLGNQWKYIPFSDSENVVLSIQINGSDIFIGTDDAGVYHSPDEGISWQNINTGLFDSTVWDMCLDRDGYLYAATNLGVYKSFDQFSDIDTESTPLISSDFTLYQNYPNPFNNTTNISFKLNKNSEVNLEIYNCRGQKIKTIISNFLYRGTHKITWDGRNDLGISVSSGLYFCCLKSDHNKQLKKIILLK